MAKNIGNGNSLPLPDNNQDDTNSTQNATQNSTQNSTQNPAPATGVNDVKKALVSSTTQRVNQTNKPEVVINDEKKPNNSFANFYLNQQLMTSGNKTTTINNYTNGTNNELAQVTKKIQAYEKRGTKLSKDELAELKRDIFAIKSNKYIYSNKEVTNFAKAVQSFNKSNLSSEKISGSLKTLKELKSGFKTRTTADKLKSFQSAPVTLGNVLKSGLDDVKKEIEYNGNGEKEAIVFTGALTVVAMNPGWRDKNRNIVAKNFAKDTGTRDSFNTGIRKVFSKNKKYKDKYIDNGYLLTGFRDLRNSADDVIRRVYSNKGKELKDKKFKVNFNSRKSTNKYTKLLNNTAKELGLASNLSHYSNAHLSYLRNLDTTTADQKVIIDAILEVKNIDKLKDAAIPEHLKELGIDTQLNQINFSKASDINYTLTCISQHLSKTGKTDYTKMSIGKLKKLLKDDSLDADTKNLIKDILTLKKHQKNIANKKFIAKTSAIKGYALLSKLAGGSDVMQGAQMAFQVASGVKMALTAANVARKVLGKTSKFVGRKTYKVAAKTISKSAKGAKAIKKIDKTVSQYNKAKKVVKTAPHKAHSTILKGKDHAKKAVTTKIKNTKLVKKASSSKILNNKFTAGVKKVTTTLTKGVSTVFSKLLSFFNFLNKLKMYILLGIGAVAIIFYLLYAVLAPFSNNAEVSAPVEMNIATDADGNLKTDENGNYIISETNDIKDSIFYKVYDLLVTTDNNWFTELEDIKTKKPSDVIKDSETGDAEAYAYFADGKVTGYWNPSGNSLYEITSFGTNDTYETGEKVNDGTYYSFTDGDSGSINRHSNIKMCISLAHGFINGDYENFPDEFKEFAMGLWNNSHSYKTKLMEYNQEATNKYIYPCINGDKTFNYKCTESQDLLNNADDNNATIKVITSDTKNSDYANVVKQTLIVTGNGCIEKTHYNNGSLGYSQYDNVLNKSLGDKTEGVWLLADTKSYSDSFTVYNSDGAALPANELITYSQSLWKNSACDNYELKEIGETEPIFCYNRATVIRPIAGCTYVGTTTYCGTHKKAPDGTMQYVCSSGCSNNKYHYIIAGSHPSKVQDKTVTKEVFDWSSFKFVTVTETYKGVSDDCDNIQLAGSELEFCGGHGWYECLGHSNVTCPGHTFPIYEVYCKGHGECNGHTANICSGHVDIDVTSTIIGLDENNNLYTKNMWDKDEIDDGTFNLYSPNYHSFEYLCDKVFGSMGTQNNPATYAETDTEHSTPIYTWNKNTGTLHWTEDMKGYTDALYNTDWFELYNLDEIYNTHKIETQIRMSDGEIKKLIEKYYPCDTDLYNSLIKTGDIEVAHPYKKEYDDRALILTRALTAVERIPYYPSGALEDLKVPLEENDFGSIVRGADGKPVVEYNGTAALYLKGLNSKDFVRWASTTSTISVNTSVNTSSPIPANKIQPGDIIKYNDSYAIYIGSDTVTMDDGATYTRYCIVEMQYQENTKGNVKVSYVNSLATYDIYQSVTPWNG